MSEGLNVAREHFIQGMSRISHFWGFSKAMGAIYGAIYLSPKPLGLDDLVTQVGVSKGAVSTNVRTLERLGMIHKRLQVGDRTDYYIAETDFWKMVRGILKEREKSEFDRALRMVDESLAMTDSAELEATEAELATFYQERMQAMKGFFNTLDNLVATLIALDQLRLSTTQKLFGKGDGE